MLIVAVLYYVHSSLLSLFLITFYDVLFALVGWVFQQTTNGLAQLLSVLLAVRQVGGSIPELVKSGTVSPTFLPSF